MCTLAEGVSVCERCSQLAKAGSSPAGAPITTTNENGKDTDMRITDIAQDTELIDEHGKRFIISDRIEQARQWANIEEIMLDHERAELAVRFEAFQARQRSLKSLRKDIARELDAQHLAEAQAAE